MLILFPKTITQRLFICFSTFFLLYSCGGIDDLKEGVNFEITTDILVSPISLQFIDATTGEAMENLTITVSGEDADKVYSNAGEADLKTINGILNIGIEKSVLPTENTPIDFIIKAEAAGYFMQAKSFSLTNLEQLEVHTLPMINKDNSPLGIENHEYNLNTGMMGQGIAEAVSIATNSSNAIINIEEGTQFFDHYGSEISGMAKVEMTVMENTPSAMFGIPGGLNNVTLSDSNGNKGEGTIVPAKVVSVDMSVGNSEITQFSNSIEIKTNIEGVIDPETGSVYALGEKFPVFYLNETNGEWVWDGNATVINDNGTLTAKYTTDHLTMFVFARGYMVVPVQNLPLPVLCAQPATLDISSDIDFNDPQHFFFTELKTQSGFYAFYWSRFYDGQEVELLRTTPGDVGTLRIWKDQIPVCGTEAVFQRDINLCSTITPIDLNGQLLPPELNINLIAKGRCQNAEELSITPLEMHLYFKQSDSPCNHYMYLGKFEDLEGIVESGGSFRTRMLEQNIAYDLFFSYGNDFGLEAEGLTIPNETSTFSIFDAFSNQNIEVDIIVEGTNITLRMNDYEIPEQYCDIFIDG